MPSTAVEVEQTYCDLKHYGSVIAVAKASGGFPNPLGHSVQKTAGLPVLASLRRRTCRATTLRATADRGQSKVGTAEQRGIYPGKNGGVEGDRTPDLLIANETLYQLSYNPSLNDEPGRMVTPRGRRKIVRQEEVSRQV